MPSQKQLLIGAALAGLLLASCAHNKASSSMASSQMGECHGVNSCKGMGECGGKGHMCAGKNSCKGKGWLKMSKKECQEKGGTFKAM